jgi:hypothetical protein
VFVFEARSVFEALTVFGFCAPALKHTRNGTTILIYTFITSILSSIVRAVSAFEALAVSAFEALALAGSRGEAKP